MAKSKPSRKQSQRVTQPETGHAKTHVVEADIPNPNFQPQYPAGGSNPKQIKAMVNMNESPAAHWLHKDLIDQAQWQAACRFRMLWEKLGSTGARGIDYKRVKVDGGYFSDPFHIGVLDARKQLEEVQSLLGVAGYELVSDVCGRCTPLGQLFPKRRVQDQKSMACRQMLIYLAEYWGFSTRINLGAG